MNTWNLLIIVYCFIQKIPQAETNITCGKN